MSSSPKKCLLVPWRSFQIPHDQIQGLSPFFFTDKARGMSVKKDGQSVAGITGSDSNETSSGS
jgi:hypothetical protein